MRGRPSSRGFVLVETLVATTLVALALGTLANVLVLGVRANVAARTLTLATWLAADKLASLQIEAPGILDGDHDEELVDARGRVIQGASASPVFVRRWSANQLSFAPGALLLKVAVGPLSSMSGQGALDGPNVVNLIAIKTPEGS